MGLNVPILDLLTNRGEKHAHAADGATSMGAECGASEIVS